MNVLVVDDNECVADSLGFLLDCYGHRAVVAYDGETALTLLRTRVFELVILDENLSGIKGTGLARSLIDTPLRRRPFVVSMTGEVDSLRDATRLFDVCLEKPFSSEALMQIMEDARSSSGASSLLAA